MRNKGSFYITVCIVGILLTSCQTKVDLIVHNAKVYTLNQNNSEVTAFVVNDGKFIDVGGEELLNQYAAKKVLDLQSLPVYPAFIDSHCHFLSLGLYMQTVDLTGTSSFEEVLERIDRFAQKKRVECDYW